MAIRWDKLTVKAQEAMQRANDVASENGNPELQPVHILAALLEDREGIVAPLLERVGLHVPTVQAEVTREIDKLPKVSGSGAAQAHLSDAASKLLENAFKEASNFKDEYVSTEHMLLGMTKLKRDPAQEILCASGRNLRQHSARADFSARQSEGDRPESRGEVPGARKICQRSDGAGAARQA